MYISTAEASDILNCTPPSTKYLLGKPDKVMKNHGNQKHLYLYERVVALAKKRVRLIKEGKLRVPPNKKVRIPINSSPEVLSKSLSEDLMENLRKFKDRYEDPYGVKVKPTFRGRMCRHCKKIEVATGQWLCPKCREVERNTERGCLDGDWVYT